MPYIGAGIQRFNTADGLTVNGNAEVTGTSALTGAATLTAGFTASDGCTITTADNSSQLTLISTDADGSSGPHLVLQRDSSSPADNDLLGQILFRGEDDGSNVVEACEMKVTARDVTNGTEDSQLDITTQVAGTARSRMVMNEVETVFNQDSQDIDLRVEGNGTTHALFVDAGNNCVGIGNSIPGSFNSGGNNLVVGTGSGSEGITIYGGNESNIFFADGTDTADSLRGRIEYSHISEGMLFYIDNTYTARFDTNQTFMVGTSTTAVNTSSSEAGCTIQSSGILAVARNGGDVASFNRQGDDGTVVQIHQAGTVEGTISVSGSTVSYNGGHLSRWSQATDGNRIDGLVKGTVMTNLDQMAVWHHADKAATYYEEGDVLPDGVSVGDEKTPFVAAHDEDNEQLNCMAVSSVEGDANVAGVFVNWDDDDKDFTADMNVAMTGDMVIRIASGTTVARGDLLMSAGDGTAKPQGDDIVRSKTIAKVTSTTKSHTYDDGSYLIPCVLMAC